MTAIAALLSRAERERLLERMAELRDTDRDMRKPGTLAAPGEPVPLHRTPRSRRGAEDAQMAAEA